MAGRFGASGALSAFGWLVFPPIDCAVLWDGSAMRWTWQGAEKTYGDFKFEVTNAGGHSSAPRDANAIAQLSGALARVGAYRFTPEVNDITRDYFAKSAAFTSDPASVTPRCSG